MRRMYGAMPRARDLLAPCAALGASAERVPEKFLIAGDPKRPAGTWCASAGWSPAVRIRTALCGTALCGCALWVCGQQYAGHRSSARHAACRPPSFGAASRCMPAASTCPDTRPATACSGADIATRFWCWNSKTRKAPCFQRQRRRKRLSLRQGAMHTRLYAPERSFCVGAPSAPRAGNSHLPESLEP